MHVDIGDVGHVAQDVGALGQAGGGHQLEHRVLGAADGRPCPTAARSGRTMIRSVDPGTCMALSMLRPRRRAKSIGSGARRAQLRHHPRRDDGPPRRLPGPPHRSAPRAARSRADQATDPAEVLARDGQGRLHHRPGPVHPLRAHGAGRRRPGRRDRPGPGRGHPGVRLRLAVPVWAFLFAGPCGARCGDRTGPSARGGCRPTSSAPAPQPPCRCCACSPRWPATSAPCSPRRTRSSRRSSASPTARSA